MVDENKMMATDDGERIKIKLSKILVNKQKQELIIKDWYNSGGIRPNIYKNKNVWCIKYEPKEEYTFKELGNLIRDIMNQLSVENQIINTIDNQPMSIFYNLNTHVYESVILLNYYVILDNILGNPDNEYMNKMFWIYNNYGNI